MLRLHRFAFKLPARPAAELGLIALGVLTVGAAQAAPSRSEPSQEIYTTTLDKSPPRYQAAPWWMREPIIAAMGSVQTHIDANRGLFSAQFSSIDRSLANAEKTAADKVRVLARTLQAYGADKARVETSLSVTPIYEQYRDKEGNLQSNERADKIDRYDVRVSFSVQVRDLSVLERAYAAVASAHPVSMGRVYFSLEPDNETNTELFKAAITDAARRARLAAEETGAKLGRVKLIDPTSRACETDVLVVGAGRGLGEDAGGVQEVVVPAAKRNNTPLMARAASDASLPAPPAPAPGEEVSADQILPLQPPLETLSRNACVIYGLE